MKYIKIICSRIFKELIYIKNSRRLTDSFFNVKILSIDETIDYMSKRGQSIVRYGDGEFMLMNGRSINDYQDFNPELGIRLRNIFEISFDENLLVCLPEPMCGVKNYKRKSRVHWTYQILSNEAMYRSIIVPGKTYGNSFVSRPYMIYKNKDQSKKWFAKIKKIFKDLDIVIIEGEYSRTGVGNDLFCEAATVKRILCPSKNAYAQYNEILNQAIRIDKESLVLIAIGPTGKVLASDLVRRGYWVLDVGHIDSEYEWFLAKANKKEKLVNKHTADSKDFLICECDDEEYKKSIIVNLCKGF